MTQGILRMEQIKFRSMDELEIFGHLSIPHSAKPLPAVLLVTGGIHGGVFQEDGDYDPLHIGICNCLNNAGYATFIVDKRGSKGYGNESCPILTYAAGKWMI